MNKKKKSIYSRFVPAVILSVVVLVLLINTASFIILLQDEKRNAAAAADLNRFYVSETDKSLKAIEEYIYLLRYNETSFISMRSENSWERVNAETNLKKAINRMVNAFPLVETVFIYDAVNGEYLNSYGGDSRAQIRNDMKDYVLGHLQEDTEVVTAWEELSLAGESYLLRLSVNRGTYIGVWVRMSDIEKPLQALRSDISFISVVTDDDLDPKSHRDLLVEHRIEFRPSQEFYSSGKGNSYYVRTDRSEVAPYCLCLVIPKNVLSGLGRFFLATLVLVSLSTVALIPLLFSLIRKDVTEPLKALDTAITEIRDGNQTYQIPPRDDPEEFVRMDEAFNTMTRQLQEAKIRSYEDVIEKQKLRLSYLQMQIRPHFFMNALTTVSNFARLGRQQELDSFISYLASYLRYMFRSNLTLVPLGDEIAHIETYLSMQELRFSGTLSHVFDIPEDMLQKRIPPFTIQNFAENVVKHAMSEQNHVTLYLQIQPEEEGMRIIVEDNGRGIPEDSLSQLNDEKYVPREGQSIGIWNTRQTLKLLYGERAGISIANSLLGGTRVELMIPYETEERMSTDEDPAV